LYRLTFAGQNDAARSRAAGMFEGDPVYLILAMSPDKVMRMKPQNLLTGLPVRNLEAVS
jgi:hypothetical protein